jgi:hypothetical protein
MEMVHRVLFSTGIASSSPSVAQGTLNSKSTMGLFTREPQMLRELLKNHAPEWVVSRDVIISTGLLELDCVSNFTRVLPRSGVSRGPLKDVYLG